MNHEENKFAVGEQVFMRVFSPDYTGTGLETAWRSAGCKGTFPLEVVQVDGIPPEHKDDIVVKNPLIYEGQPFYIHEMLLIDGEGFRPVGVTVWADGSWLDFRRGDRFVNGGLRRAPM